LSYGPPCPPSIRGPVVASLSMIPANAGASNRVMFLMDRDPRGEPTARPPLCTKETTTDEARSRRTRTGLAIFILIVLAMTVAFLIGTGLRSCVRGSTVANEATPTSPLPASVPSVTVVDLTSSEIENRIYEALRPIVLANTLRLSSLVTIVEVSTPGEVVAVIHFSGEPYYRHLGTVYRVNYQEATSDALNAVLVLVPQVQKVVVVKGTNTVLGTATRR